MMGSRDMLRKERTECRWREPRTRPPEAICQALSCQPGDILRFEPEQLEDR